MPRKPIFAMEHVKTVKRNGVEYLYFNTGQKNEHDRAIYAAIGKKGDTDVGTRYSKALAARTRRAGAPSSLLIPELVARYQRGPEFTKKSGGTQRTYGIYLNRLAKEMSTAPVMAVESSDIYRLMDIMASKPAAVDMLLLAGDQMFAWATKRKLANHNPFTGIDREDWETTHYEPWPEAVVEEALADTRLSVAVALLYFTAQRIGDCCKLAWTDIDDGEVRVIQQKTGKELHVPVHSRLAEILGAAPRRGLTVLADHNGKKIKDQTLRNWIADFGKSRGLKLVPHGLRKNAVIALLEAGCTVGETSSISGQSLQMVELYAKKRNSRRMGKAAMAKWEQASNRETAGKTGAQTT